MSTNLTKQLGIEFERRLQLIDPNYEIVGKLDTETIYSFLNEYQYKYVQQLLTASAQPVEDRSKINTHVLSKVQGALRKNIVVEQDTELDELSDDTTNEKNKYTGELPKDFMYYIGTEIQTKSSYNGNGGKLSGILLGIADFDKIKATLYDEDRIMRNPLVLLLDGNIYVYADRYTNIKTVVLYYYKQPSTFTILGTEKAACELPDECFDDLVTGAVDLFIATKYKLQAKQNKESNKEDK